MSATNKNHDALIKRIDEWTSDTIPDDLMELLQDCRAALSQAQAEVARLRQGLWDCYKAAGGDTDGDDTPDAVVTDIVEPVLACVTDLRECYDDALTKKYVPMTDDERNEMMARWYENHDLPSISQYIESEVIRRAGLEVAND